jgi:hypothetical protein
MNVKSLCLAGLAAALLGLGQARAQYTTMPYGSRGGPPGDGAAAPDAAPAPAAPAITHSLSDWITYPRPPGCCGPTGADGPICSELYLRSGVSVPIGGGFLNRVVNVGWDVEGGVRALFFNPAMDAAWTVDAGITNIFNPSEDRVSTVALRNFVASQNGQTATLPALNVGVRSENRTFVDLAGGREWWLMGAAGCTDGPSWRAGVDGGGRYGAEKINLTNTRHRTDAIGGVFAALHSDLEMPWGGCIVLVGGRVEWSYTWSDILQRQNRTDNEDINLMLTAGVRY